MEIENSTDFDEAFNQGDVELTEKNVAEAVLVDQAFQDALADEAPEDRNMAVLGVLHALYGDELVVL